VKEKYCPHCDRTMIVDEFARNKSTKDGRNGWCKDCQYYGGPEQAARTRKASGIRLRARSRVKRTRDVVLKGDVEEWT